MFNHRSYFQGVGHQRAIAMMRERSLDNLGVTLDRLATDLATLAKSFEHRGDGPIVDPEIGPALERGLTVVRQGRLALIGTVTQTR